MEADIAEWIDGRTTHAHSRGKTGKWCEGGREEGGRLFKYVAKIKLLWISVTSCLSSVDPTQWPKSRKPRQQFKIKLIARLMQPYWFCRFDRKNT